MNRSIQESGCGQFYLTWYVPKDPEGKQKMSMSKNDASVGIFPVL
jgi:hypothetical protein